MEKNEAKNDLRFEACKFSSLYRLNSNIANVVGISNSTFLFDFLIWDGKIVNHLALNGSVFNNLFSIKTVYSDGSFSSLDNEFKKDTEVIYSDIQSKRVGGFKNIYIAENIFKSGILFQGHQDDTPINLISIESSNGLNGVIKFENFVADSILIKGINSNCVLSFNSFKTRNLEIIDYFNNSSTQFLNFEGNPITTSKLIISNSNLGKALFSNFDFKSFNEIIFDNATITEIITTNVVWFLPQQLHIKASTRLTESKAKRSLFKQLKLSQEKQSDTIQSLIFKSYEYEAYREEIKNKESSFGDRIILIVNSISKHGTYWQGPVLLILLFAFILNGIIFIIGNQFTTFETTKSGVIHLLDAFFVSNWSAFFQILNPVFSTEKIYPGNFLGIWSVQALIALPSKKTCFIRDVFDCFFHFLNFNSFKLEQSCEFKKL